MEVEEGYKQSVDDYLASSESCQSELATWVRKLREVNLEMRQHLVQITKKSEVQVEPEHVTKILDKFVEKIDNLVMCGVPGAGGDDAVSHG